MTAPATLEELRTSDANFPHEALIGCQTALILFAAGFYGKQDAFWIAEAGLQGTCVDSDETRLLEMREVYPEGWQFLTGDAYEFASGPWSWRRWDVVTLDPWTQDFARCADNIQAWCRLARTAVIIGTGTETILCPPDGWRVAQVRQRSTYAGGVFWTLLERV